MSQTILEKPTINKSLVEPFQSGDVRSQLNNIYHITYAPETKEVDLFFWGCNFECRGCYRKKNIYSLMLEENLGVPNEEPGEYARPPERFLSIGEVMRALENLEVKHVLAEGFEPSIDPLYPKLVEAFHRKFGTYNTLLTNAYQLPVLEHTDAVVVSIKCINDSLHLHYTGKSNKRVFENFRRLYQSGMKLVVESVYIPDYIDIDETERIARFIAGVDKNIPYIILPYIKANGNDWRRPVPEEMERAASIAKRHLNNVRCFLGDEKVLYNTNRIA